MRCLEVAHSLTLPEEREIDCQHLPERFLRGMGVAQEGQLRLTAEVDTSKTLDEKLGELERAYLAAMIGECEGNLSEVSRRADKARQTILNKLKGFRTWLAQGQGPEFEFERSRLQKLAGMHWRVIEREAGADEEIQA